MFLYEIVYDRYILISNLFIFYYKTLHFFSSQRVNFYYDSYLNVFLHHCKFKIWYIDVWTSDGYNRIVRIELFDNLSR